MSETWYDEDQYGTLSTGSAHSVSDKPRKRKKHPIGFALPESEERENKTKRGKRPSTRKQAIEEGATKRSNPRASVTKSARTPRRTTRKR